MLNNNLHGSVCIHVLCEIFLKRMKNEVIQKLFHQGLWRWCCCFVFGNTEHRNDRAYSK